jgi:hypothetical protein
MSDNTYPWRYPMIDGGIFTLKTAEQLLSKLRRDLERVRAAPGNADEWFNFIVTADHLPEWEFAADEGKAKALRQGQALLRVCHHLAVNAKHFKTRKPNPGISTAASSSFLINFGDRRAPSRRSPPAHEGEEFFLLLSGEDAKDLGGEISALDLALLLVEFWRGRIERSTPPPRPQPG